MQKSRRSPAVPGRIRAAVAIIGIETSVHPDARYSEND
jgi:hypothetical protein